MVSLEQERRTQNEDRVVRNPSANQRTEVRDWGQGNLPTYYVELFGHLQRHFENYFTCIFFLPTATQLVILPPHIL